MSKSRLISVILLLALAAGMLVWWMVTGAHMWHTTAHMVQVKDELFGTTTEKWVGGFQPGFDIAGPVAGGLLAIAGWIVYSSKRKYRQVLTAVRA